MLDHIIILILPSDVAGLSINMKQELLQLKPNGVILFFDVAGKKYQKLRPNGTWTVEALPAGITDSTPGVVVDAKFFLNSGGSCSLL